MSKPLMPIPPTDADFPELNALRRYLERLLDVSVPSLALYWRERLGGFVHIIDAQRRDKLSPASTATCISYLTHSGRWDEEDGPWLGWEQDLVDQILAPDFEWESGGLSDNNFFTSAFLLQALGDLQTLNAKMPPARSAFRRARLNALEQELAKGHGVAIANWPGSTFLTYKVVLALEAWRDLSPEVKSVTATWAWHRLTDESVGVSDGWPDSDVQELIYACMLAGRCTPADQLSEKQREALEFSVGQFFAAQTPRGRWPLSRPLFLYEKFGNAYCYDYEVLTHLLAEPSLSHLLHRHIGSLRQAANSLDDTKAPIGDEGQDLYGWATGHVKRENPAPESWSTASAYHFCFLLHRIVSEVIRRTTFAYADVNYVAPTRENALPPVHIQPKDLMDSEIREVGGGRRSLRRTIETHFLVPLRDAAGFSEHALQIPRNVPTSAILFGPPGTSKTTLARIVAEKLGWPLLRLDPSHLTRRGMDLLHAETNHIFSMLAACEELVVLFDEFDELVLDRDREGSESVSRFLTTAMLPKLTALSERRRIVYLLATNHVERFDPAIRRRGRFDMIIPVLPPTFVEKVSRWPVLESRFNAAKLFESDKRSREARELVADLTFDECDDLRKQLMTARSRAAIERELENAARSCTMRQLIHPDARNLVADSSDSGSQEEEQPTWKSQMRLQRIHIRIPSEPDSTD